MSFQASKWVADQTAGSPSAKSVLYALANYADFNGTVFASQKRIAADTEQSVDSVQRRMKELERRGLIYRTPQTRLEKGRAAGSWSVSFTILLMDDISISFALKHGYDPAAPAAQSVENADFSKCENDEQENQGDDGDTEPQIAARLDDGVNENNGLDGDDPAHRTADCGSVISGEKAGHRAADCGSDRTALLRHGIVNSEPLSPFIPRSSSPNAPALDEGSWLGEWERLKALWPPADTGALDQARERFRLLPPDERAIALKGAANYVACKRQLRAPLMTLRNFLRTGQYRDWENKVSAEMAFVRKGSDAWRAWLAYRGVKSLPTVTRTILGKPVEGWAFPTLFPPARASPSDVA